MRRRERGRPDTDHPRYPLQPRSGHPEGDGGRGRYGRQFDRVHAKFVDTRTDTPNAVIWAHNYGIVLNENYERFCDERQDYLFASFELVAHDTWRYQNQKSYFITDSPIIEQFRGSWTYEPTDISSEETDTIGEVAEKLGLDLEKLEETVKKFNAAIMDDKSTTGIEPPGSNWANPIETPPFYGFPMTANLNFTYGGIKTDTDARVLSTNGVPIPSLYAAGEMTGLYYHKYPPATSVLRSLTFGRIAGTNVAKALSGVATAAG